MRGICPARVPAAATDRTGAHAAAAHTGTATEPAPGAHASATTAATPGVSAVDRGSRNHEYNRDRGCADVFERGH
jgi:hypothetical protein